MCDYGDEQAGSAPLSYAQQAAGAPAANGTCVDAYNSVALAGYCVPAAPASQGEYDAAGVAVGALPYEEGGAVTLWRVYVTAAPYIGGRCCAGRAAR